MATKSPLQTTPKKTGIDAGPPLPQKKTRAPKSFAPVPFSIAKASVDIDAFVDELPRGRASYYRTALETLQDSPKGSVLRFESLKCLPQLHKQAKALGLKLRFYPVGEEIEVAIVADKPR